MATIDRNTRPRADIENRDLRTAEPRGRAALRDENRDLRPSPRPDAERPRDESPQPRRPRDDARDLRPRPRDDARDARPRRDDARDLRPSRTGLSSHDERRPRDPSRPDERRPRREDPRPGLSSHDERRARDQRRPPDLGLPSQDERRPRDEARPEIKICGVNACQAVAERRPDDVRRVYLRESLLPAFGPFLKRCAAARIAYHVVEELELEKITQSTHHEGVCFIVRERPPVSLRELLAVDGARCLVYLDGVQNPHNLGAIVRVCAHFGAAAVLVAGVDAGVSTAMLRTAEGGGEWVDVVTVADGPEPLQAARAAGYRLIATAARAPHDLHARRLPPRSIILLGSETHGLSPAIQKLADESVRIPGTGNLDSLNVACACAVLLGEYWRAHPRPRA